MPVVVVLIALLLPLLIVLAIPFSLVQRYRVGSARRQARGWVAMLNLLLMVFSVALYLSSAAFTNFWVPEAFRFALLGSLTGGAVGFAGLWLTCWERSERGLHYTPNRWLVLFLIVIVAARVLYSFWRGWHTWQTSAGAADWFQQAGVATSLGVGGLVLGYYLIYSLGVFRRIHRHSLTHASRHSTR